MPNGTCCHECVKIVTKLGSYTVDGPISLVESLPADAADRCPQHLSDEEAAEVVASYIVNNRITVEEPACCPEGCTCRPYKDRADLKPRPLVPFNAKRCIQFVKQGPGLVLCVYRVCFTVHVEQTVYPLGFCVKSEPEPQASGN
jgi:hypothetical protein